jgi:uncharacterized repeat protein (TIGR01451 family)
MPSRLRQSGGAAARPGRGWTGVAALAAAAILLLAGSATALGAPGTLRVLERTPTLGRQVTLASPGGGTFRSEPGGALVRVAPSGGPALETPAWCIDRSRPITLGIDYPVDLETAPGAPELSGSAAREAGWLIGRAESLIAASSAPGLEAGAIQVAVWQLTGQVADVPAPTSDPGLNSRVAALRALAAGRAPASSLALAGPAGPVTTGVPATVTVTGTPGADVGLEVTAGAGILSAPAVTLGADGTAVVLVTPLSPGPVAVAARADGGVLWRAAALPGRTAPQTMAWLAPGPLASTATLTAVAAQTAIRPSEQRPAQTAGARLRLAKTAPAGVVRGRAIAYTLTVTNASDRTARAVVVRDALPADTFVARMPARATLSGSTLVWRLGDLAPHARVTVRARLRTLPSAAQVVRNVAQASAANAATVRARAATRLRPAPRVAPLRVPVVTG